MYPLDNFLGGIIFFVIWLLLMLGIIAGWIIFLVAVWRGMKAHESIAESLKELSSRQKE